MYLNSEKYYASMLGLGDDAYGQHVSQVKSALGLKREACVRVGASLYAFYHAIKRRRQNNFYKVCDDVFKLDKSQVSRYVRVMEEFGNEDHTGIAEEYTDYSFMLLMELLTIPKEERHKVNASQTVRNVRELRRVLERDSASDPDAADEAADCPPDRYARFKRWKRADLCEKILKLEKQIEDLMKGK